MQVRLSGKRWFKPLVFLLVIALVAGGWVLYFHNQWVGGSVPQWGWLQYAVLKLGQNKEPAAEEDEDPDNTKNEIPVHVARVAVATQRRYIEGFGVVTARPVRGDAPAGGANLSSPVAGVVAKVLCRIGQPVHAGDPLVQLDDRLAKSAEDQAQAGLAQAQASLAALKANPRPDQLQIAQLTVEKAAAAEQLAKRAYDRLQQLIESQGTSTKSVEQGAADLASARVDLAVAQKQLAILKASPTPEELAQEESKVAQAAAALATAKTQRLMMTITSPIDASVVAITANAGESVDLTKPLVQLVSMDRLMVDLDIPADQLPPKAEGLSAEVLVASASFPPVGSKDPVSGRVATISPQVDAKNGTVLVSVDLPANCGLQPGLAVRVRIIADEHKDVFVVPRDAVTADENGDSVVSIVEKDQATHKAVKAGIEENGLIEIDADGIKEGVLVVTGGAYGLPAASRVKVLE